MSPHPTFDEDEVSRRRLSRPRQDDTGSNAQTDGELDFLSTVHDKSLVHVGPGSRIRHYEIVSELGHGAMGIVFKALDTQLNRLVALKLLRPGKMSDSQSRDRFLREAETASALNHPNIVTIYEVGQERGWIYIAMEFAAGRTLPHCIGKKGLDVVTALRYGIQIADALAAAQEAGIVHRDLKPSNVVVSDKGVVKLLDFGLAKAAPVQNKAPAQGDLTAEGTIVGTCAYMSPEQAEGKPVDSRSDIFSFGSTLYEMITGTRAFDRDTTIGVLSAILHKDPTPLAKIKPDMPKALERVLLRCMQKSADQRWQNAFDLRHALEDVLVAHKTGELTEVRTPRAWYWPVLVVAGVAAVTTGITAVLRMPAPAAAAREPVLSMLTSGSGLNAFPTMSGDGKLVAFASDQSGEDNLDIWVQQIGGGEPIRLTEDAADEHSPAMSRDGTRIVFRSEREGGGVYIVPALGGSEPQLVVQGGRSPSFSPDDRQISYWVGKEGGQFLPGSASIFIVPATGGVPKQFHSEFAAALFPIWSPSGHEILFLGRLADEPFDKTLDWWVAPVDRGAPKRTGALAALRAQQLRWPPGQFTFLPAAWTSEGREVLFAASFSDAVNLWRVPVLPDKWTVSGPATRVTAGTSFDLSAAVVSLPQAVRMAYSSNILDVDVWTLPADVDTGTPTGPLKKITEDVLFDAYPSLSLDGSRMAFASGRMNLLTVRVRDFGSGKEYPLPITGSSGLHARISSTGRKIAYWDHGKGLCTIDARGGTAEKLCDTCGPPTDFRDNEWIVFEPLEPPDDVMAFDLVAKTTTSLVSTKGLDHALLFGGRLSPDGQWVAFHGYVDRTENMTVFVAPLQHGRASQKPEWIPVTKGNAIEGEAAWSPSGNLLYFLSERDGFRCLWARKLDGRTKRPAAEPFCVQHFHSARRSLKRLGNRGGLIGMSVAPGKVVLALGELTGNIWLTETPR